MSKKGTFAAYTGRQADDMIEQLQAHQGEKGGPGAWLDGDPLEWVRQARFQINQLEEAILLRAGARLLGRDGMMGGGEIRRRAAHACNYVMMAATTEMSRGRV